MAKTVITNGYLSVAANVLSSYVRSMTLTYTGDAVDSTTMGSSTRTREPGLRDWSLSVEFAQDHAVGLLDAILFPLLGTSVAIEVRGNAAAVGTSNPKFTGNAIFTSYPPVAGSIGDLITASATFSGNGNLTRGTS